MKATGERFISDEAWGYRSEIEHRHRYSLLDEVVKEKLVLDAACGSGYGSYIISRNARMVIGIDISKEAVDFCKQNYTNSNLKYMQMSVAKMDFEDNTFDVVVSFETIEHLPYTLQCDFLKEITRVLKKDGLLIISSPDRNVRRIMYHGVNNPYHIHEFLHDEFREFLQSNFDYVKFEAQNIVEVSWVSPEDEAEGTYDVMLSKHFERTLPSKYVIAICSNCKNTIAGIEFRSFYVPNIMQYFHETFDLFGNACLYRDMGKGFVEEDKIVKAMTIDANAFYVRYEFDNYRGAKVRFDPCERCCRISHLKIKSNCSVDMFMNNSDVYDNETYIFLNPDPYFVMGLAASEEKKIVLEFSGEIEALSEQEVYSLHKELDVGKEVKWLDTMAVCYYDTGHGYNETEKIYAEYYRIGNLFKTNFQLPQNIIRFRIDPCLQGQQPLWYHGVKINGKSIDFQEENIVTVNKRKSFCGKNPYFIFECKESSIEFEIHMYSLTIEDFKIWLQKYY